MLRRRRLSVASTAVVCGSLALAACSGGDSGGGASPTESATSSSPSSESSPSETSEPETSTGPPEESPSPDPTAIDCTITSQKHIDEWTRGGRAASLEPTEDGCRVVSSSQDGAVMVEWRWLDPIESGGDASILQQQEREGDLVTVAPGIEGRRVESDVAPTRNSRTSARIDDRYLFVESTVTLDRNQTLADLRRAARQLAMTYADAPPPSPSEP